ncbi:MAG: hypothetical protein ACYDEN_04790, partial [Acidimicrobiales bacterium]
DYARLCAHVAARFPDVRYFVVWSELRHFYLRTSHRWDYQAYTALYNEVYAAVKAVRPTAQIGGPYAALTTTVVPPSGGPGATLPGVHGYFQRGMLQAVSYWLRHKVGAQFVAVDGATVVASSGNAAALSPLLAAQQYASVDRWIRAQTSLPIWWMESHIQPREGWTVEEGAAARVATLAEMAASGASVGMQWQPQEQLGWPDEGLWTSTLTSSGGQPTRLAELLHIALPVLAGGPRYLDPVPRGVLAVSDAAGTLIINTSPSEVEIELHGARHSLGPYAVRVFG